MHTYKISQGITVESCRMFKNAWYENACDESLFTKIVLLLILFVGPYTELLLTAFKYLFNDVTF